MRCPQNKTDRSTAVWITKDGSILQNDATGMEIKDSDSNDQGGKNDVTDREGDTQEHVQDNEVILRDNGVKGDTQEHVQDN